MDSAGSSRHHQVLTFLFCSLDGFHEGAGGDLTWNSRFIDSEFFDWNLRQNRGVGSLVLGRRTYDHFAGFWPSPEAVDRMPRTAAFMNDVPKLVVTRTLETASWSGTRIVDELRILVHPVLLGEGRHMYPGLSRSLELATTWGHDVPFGQRAPDLPAPPTSGSRRTGTVSR